VVENAPMSDANALADFALRLSAALGALDNLKGKLKAVFKKRGEKKSEKKAKDKAKQAADQNTAEGGTATAAAEATKTETAAAPAGESRPTGDLTSPLDIRRVVGH
jgi:hypothetical protein